MSDAVLREFVVDRLGRQAPDSLTQRLVLSGFDGADAVAAVLADRDGDGGADAVATESAVDVVAAAYIASIEVEGFRGIGPRARLDIAPGPGLTLIVGRNGSGKSSFAEALELLLTGTNQRWTERSKVWGQGWRNLHHATTAVSASFITAGGAQPLTISRTWTAANDLGDAVAKVTGRPAASIAQLGWTHGLTAYPPLLSHNELGRVLDRTSSALYDALASILGLQELTDAQTALRSTRLSEKQLVSTAETNAAALLTLAAPLDDDRARTLTAALGTKTWDLAAVRQSVGYGAEVVEEAGVLSALRALASLGTLSREDMTDITDELRAAQAKLEHVGRTDAGRARKTAELLQQAVDHHAAHGGTDCPVCGTRGTLGYEWALATKGEIDKLRAEAADADAAHRAASTVRQRAALFVVRRPNSLSTQADVAGLDLTAIRTLWDAFADTPTTDGLIPLAQHIDTTGPPLFVAIADVRRRATAELERREDLWRPIAQRVTVWLPQAERAITARSAMVALKAAEDWLRDAHDDIREARFAPIATEVQQNWTTLRQDSNVELGELRLTGSTTQRRLQLDVTVDGTESAALSVMSQGELNCLALSLFLPRASLRESPFRFLVIDDPVQAMDPSKVEGLARTLERVAQDRQVLVFTHDDRLPEIARRLDVRATVIEVTRREQSVVALRTVQDPVGRYFDDAFALTHHDLPPAARRAIPGLCRMALEAACQRAITRRMVAAGRSHEQVDAALATPTTLLMWLALWRFDDAGRSGEVMNSIRNAGFTEAVSAVTWCNRGAHERTSDDPRAMLRAAEALVGFIAGGAAHAG